jgi:hypothetical protein
MFWHGMHNIGELGFHLWPIVKLCIRASGGGESEVITLRNLSPELASRLLRRSRQTGMSLARTVVSLLEERLGVGRATEHGDVDDGVDSLAGNWSREQADEFDRALAQQRAIDLDLWH